MKTMKMALLAGAAVAVSAAAAHADELSDMKAQIEALNARVAAMETAPSVPSGYQLLAVSKGEALQIPGLDQSHRDRFTQGDRATVISVMPTADAPAGTTISWSGYVRAAVIYAGGNGDETLKLYGPDENGDKELILKATGSVSQNDDWDVKARGQLRVVATTDTAVGEVGVELKMRADFAGNGSSDVYMNTAWGYWAMTPELTFGGGYAGSLGNIGYGYDGACTCYYTDNADVGFNPGDTTQLRLSYASGPFSMGVALEDASLKQDSLSGNNLGAAGELKYSGDSFSGEISGVYRAVNSADYNGSGNFFSNVGPLDSAGIDLAYESNTDSLWQVGVGLGFNLGDIASLSLAAAMGSGPAQEVDDNGDIYASYNVNNDWWGVSGLASANLSDTVHAEVGVGYKDRQGDGYSLKDDAGDKVVNYSGYDYNTWAVLGGVYYTPVDQLTIGLEGEWYTTSISRSVKGVEDSVLEGYSATLDENTDNWSVDLVSVWRF